MAARQSGNSSSSRNPRRRFRAGVPAWTSSSRHQKLAESGGGHRSSSRSSASQQEDPTVNCPAQRRAAVRATWLPKFTTLFWLPPEVGRKRDAAGTHCENVAAEPRSRPAPGETQRKTALIAVEITTFLEGGQRALRAACARQTIFQAAAMLAIMPDVPPWTSGHQPGRNWHVEPLGRVNWRQGNPRD